MEQNKLLAVIQIFRHGERLPVHIYPNNPRQLDFYQPLELGELTNNGKRSIYELGRFTRQRYQHFLPETYSKKDFLLYSTPVNRCNMSAQLFATGLYPPTDREIWKDDLKWNPIPVFTCDSRIMSGHLNFCSRYTKIINEAVSEYWLKFKQDPFYSFIEQNTGLHFKNHMDVMYFLDNLSVESFIGLEQPEWTKKLPPEFVEKYDKEHLLYIVKNEEIRSVLVGPFLNQLVEHFEKMALDDTSGPKLISYSGHDASIAPFLYIFAELDERPNFAASLYFELWRKNGENVINIFYKRKEIEPIKIDGKYFDITLNDFKQLIDKYIVDGKVITKDAV